MAKLQPEILAEWLDIPETEPQWLLHPFLPRESIVLMSGPQKRARKTWFAFVMALAVATGKGFAGYKPEHPQGRPVTIVEEEGTGHSTRDRFRKLADMLGVAQSEMANIQWLFRQRLKLDNPSQRRELVGLVERHRSALVVLDALTYLHSGDENSVQDMLPIVESLAAIRNTGASALVLAHVGKSSGDDNAIDIDNQVRGSSVVINAYDVHLALRPKKQGIDCIIRGRDCEERKLSLRWDFSGGSVGLAIRGERSEEG